VRIISVRSPKSKALETLISTRNAVSIASREHFDLLHIHSVGPANVIPLARRLGFRRVVVTIHAPDYLQAKWGRLARWYLMRGERLAATGANALIVVSQAVEEKIASAHGRAAKVIPNGPGRTERRPAGEFLRSLELNGKDYLLFVGRLIPDKRVEDLITAVQLGEFDLKVVVAGDSSHTNSYVNALKNSAAGNVIFPGCVYGKELDELYSNAIAFVLPSAIEGLSVSLLEAMASELPVVASDIPANREAVGSEECGILYPLGDAKLLADALQRVVGDARLRMEIGANARRRVERVFSWDVIAHETARVYKAVLGEAGEEYHLTSSVIGK